MGANRLAVPFPKRPSPSPVWSMSNPPSISGVARPTGTVDLFSFPSGSRKSVRSPCIPTSSGIPTSLSLRPPSAPESYPLTVVGTDTGHILLDEESLVNLGSAPVLCTSYDSEVIVAAGGAAKEVVVIDPERRKLIRRFSLQQHHISPITSVVLLDAKRAMFCSQAITLIDLSSGKLLTRYAGHKTPVKSAVKFNFGGVQHVATACEDSYVSVWRIDGKKFVASQSVKDKRMKLQRTTHTGHTVGVLKAPQPGVQTLCVDENEGATVSLAAALQSGEISVWRNCKFERGQKGKAAVSLKHPSFLVRRSGDVFALGFPMKRELAVLYGAPLKPTAHSILLDSVSDNAEVELPPVDSNVIMAEGPVATEEARIRLVQETAQLHVLPSVPVDRNAAVATAKRKQNGMVHLNGNDDDDDDGDDDDDVEVVHGSREGDRMSQVNSAVETIGADDRDKKENSEDMSIEEKLVKLGLEVQKEDEVLRRGKGTSVLDATRLDSRVSVLLQAVKLRDSQMLDSCLGSTSDPNLIRKTIELVPSEVASGLLLEMLVDRLRRHPHRAEGLTRWIRVVLMEHASAILTQQRSEAIASLSAIIEERTKSLASLTRLQGRLELVICQSERINYVRGIGRDPVAEYVEEADDGSPSGTDDDSSSEEDGGSSDDLESSSDDDRNDNRGIGSVSKGSQEGSSSQSERMESDAVLVVKADSVVEPGKKAAGSSGGKKMNGPMNGKMDVSDGESESDESDDDD